MPDDQTTAPAITVDLTENGITFDPATLAFMIADTAPIAIETVVSVPPLNGRAGRDFLVSVTERGTTRGATTMFDALQALSEMGFVGALPPDWSLGDGFARLIPSKYSRAHGAWVKAAGDGLYRCLVRWSGAEFEYSLDRRFSFGVGVGLSGADWTGARLDAFMTSAGDSRIQLRAYEGVKGRTTVLASADAPWAYDAWHWIEVEVAGPVLRARIYAESADRPDWQVTGVVAPTATGAFGPGGFPALEESPVIDLRRIEYVPASA